MRSSYWIVLDTSVVTQLARGDTALGLDLAALAALRGSSPVSLSQTAYIEIANQLRRQQRFTFEQWQTVAPALGAVIDPEHPIIPTGVTLRVMLGVATIPQSTLRHALRGLRAMWHVLRTASTQADLAEGRRITFEGEMRRFRASAIRRELDQTEQRWKQTFAGLVAELGRPVADGDRPRLAEGIRKGIGEDDVHRVPELETAVQLAVEWLVISDNYFCRSATTTSAGRSAVRTARRTGWARGPT